MIDQSRNFRKTAVLGAGVMGAQIAAHLANTGVPVVLYDLAEKKGDPNGLVKKALKVLTQLRPSPLASRSVLETIYPANYEQHLDLVKDCDLVIEAISERIDWKHGLYNKITPVLKRDAVLASNTSGISISKLAEPLPDHIKSRFCGIHFFNPPRYLYLIELIPHSNTDPKILDTLEEFLTKTIGKGVIRAKDTPGFIANRVGSFSVFTVFYHTERLGLPFDLVDKLTGPSIGRAKSATYRTSDIVGLDTMVLVTEKSLADNLKNDPWHKYIRVPDWLKKLVAEGSLGQKTGIGIYKKINKDIFVLDKASHEYRLIRDDVEENVRKILKIPEWGKRFAALQKCQSPQAEFLLSIFRDLFHYSAYHLSHIAKSARDIDLAIRWGFGWKQGPFEIWQAAGWKTIAKMIQEGIETGKTMSSAPLPEWALDNKRKKVHSAKGSWSPAEKRMIPRSRLTVYKRQIFPNLILGEYPRSTHTVFETKDVRMWHTGDDIGIFSFKTKMNIVNSEIIEGIRLALEEAEKNYKALILWQPSGPFCSGTDLNIFIKEYADRNNDTISEFIRQFQKINMALMFSYVPTIAAVRGSALGGGCELMMHCDRIVASLETYTGLIETSLGLTPAGGGIKEMVQRAAADSKGHLLLPHIVQYFEQVVSAKISNSALEAREMGYLQSCDKIVPNAFEILHVAKQTANDLYEAGYRPPQKEKNILVLGKAGSTFLQVQLTNSFKGNFISEHDYYVGSQLASVFTGGEVDEGQKVNYEWLIQKEHDLFMDLVMKAKTQERIRHMLKNGKPLHN